jgi:hypothetical protein
VSEYLAAHGRAALARNREATMGDTNDQGVDPVPFEAPERLELEDGRVMTRVPRSADGTPVRPAIEVGFKSLGGPPRVRLVPEPRVLSEWDDPDGNLAMVWVAYPALRIFREGSEIEVPGRGWYRVMNPQQVHRAVHPDLRPGEVVIEIRTEPVD